MCEAGYVPTPHQPGHEKTPHSAWGHSSAKHAANRGLGVTLPVATPVPGAKATAVDLQVISGETALSRKLEIRENVTAALAILANLRGACTVLFEALCKDVKATGEDNLAGLLSLAPDTDTHPFLIHHTSDVPPPRAASTATDAAAPTVMTVAESLAQELQQEQQSKLRQPLQPEPQTLYVSRRALREQAARKKRPLVRMNINATSSAVVHGATVEQQLHPFRLIQKITDIATKVSVHLYVCMCAVVFRACKFADFLSLSRARFYASCPVCPRSCPCPCPCLCTYIGLCLCTSID